MRARAEADVFPSFVPAQRIAATRFFITHECLESERERLVHACTRVPFARVKIDFVRA